jgi:hypothetical protein
MELGEPSATLGHARGDESGRGTVHPPRLLRASIIRERLGSARTIGTRIPQVNGTSWRHLPTTQDLLGQRCMSQRGESGHRHALVDGARAGAEDAQGTKPKSTGLGAFRFSVKLPESPGTRYCERRTQWLCDRLVVRLSGIHSRHSPLRKPVTGRANESTNTSVRVASACLPNTRRDPGSHCAPAGIDCDSQQSGSDWQTPPSPDGA